MSISDGALRALNEPVEISDELVAFYEENGWIKIEGVLPREAALELWIALDDLTPEYPDATGHTPARSL